MLKLASPQGETEVPSSSSVQSPSNEAPDMTRNQRQTAIKQLEAALATLHGAEHAALRDSINQEIASHKQAIISDKPLGQRRDHCKAALERAKKRPQQAREALRLTEAAVQAAEKEELRLAQELADLQQAISEAPVQEEGLAALKSQLEAACQQLSKVGGTHPDAIADAEARSRDLFLRFEASLAQHAAKEAGGMNVPRRHSAKSPPVPGEDTSAPGVPLTHRHVGKQPLQPQEKKKKKKQQTLTNYFNLSSGIPDPAKMAPSAPAEPGPRAEVLAISRNATIVSSTEISISPPTGVFCRRGREKRRVNFAMEANQYHYIPDLGFHHQDLQIYNSVPSRWKRHCKKRARNGAQLILATFNVQTLDPKERRQLRRIGESVTARTHYVEDFFNKHHIQLAGVQESRLPDSGCQDLDHYFTFSAPSTDDGLGGVQIWPHKDLKVLASTAAANAVSPRLLRTEFSAAGLTLTAISAHAPVASARAEEERAFWASLQKELAAALHKRALIVFIDGNDDDEAAGVNSNYQFALECRLAHDLQDAAELSGTIEPTWFGIPGHEKRSDHVWLGPRWHRKLHATSVLQDSLCFSEREDHRVVKATVALDQSLGPKPAPSPKMSSEKLHDPKIRQALETDMFALADEPQHNVTQGPDVYHAQMIEHVQDLQRKHFFAPASQVPKKPWISSTSWALIKNTPGIRRATQSSASLSAHRNATRALTRADRQTWAEGLARQADVADRDGNTKALFGSARQIRTPRGFQKHAKVNDEQGRSLCDPGQISSRWKRHWVSLFAGQILPMSEVAAHVQQFMPLFNLATSAATAPAAMKGGKLFDIWKQKGDPANCDSSRGLGALCFNLGYGLGLGRARRRFTEEGVVLQLLAPAVLAAPWGTILDDKPNLHETTNTPNDAEYVDGAVFMFQQQQEGRTEQATKAQQSFAPLAVPIFGSSHIQLRTKLMLAQSLILSRALYAVAAWRGQLDKGWQPLEAQYHRVLRRINGTMRYGAPDTITDAAVREASRRQMPAALT
ncbi:unnamed protein product [Prorocentrum cordatum]|uniref:Endonuclease/exonuclease/phosphatase domain-containing protein n=1 Tax=Prorocentrum cordatum TaxID=2364126 RepID=A0ABN9WBN7_9DINO|nr:unnamed protein product [Polarella glacialis]